MAKGWLRAIRDAPDLRERVQLVGFVDLNLHAAKALQAEFGPADAVVDTDLAAVLSTAKPKLVFDVAVPSARHDVVMTALSGGCHLLTEKPMAVSLEDARAQIAAATAASRIYAVVQNRRFVNGVRRIRETLASGVLGNLTALHADFFIGAHFGGFREQMEHVLLLDMAIHTFDTARFISRADAVAVYCLETNPLGSWYRHGAAANAIFEFSNDIVFTYRGSWVAEGGATSWESRWRVIGTAGTLLWDGAENFEAQIVSGESGFLRPLRDVAVSLPPHPEQTLGHASVIADFLDAVETGRAPETSGADNIKSLAMVLGAIESARTHRRILIEA
jgi:predicted dehydrogenase